MFAKCFARIILQYVRDGSRSLNYNHYFPVAKGEGKIIYMNKLKLYQVFIIYFFIHFFRITQCHTTGVLSMLKVKFKKICLVFFNVLLLKMPYVYISRLTAVTVTAVSLGEMCPFGPVQLKQPKSQFFENSLKKHNWGAQGALGCHKN